MTLREGFAQALASIVTRVMGARTAVPNQKRVVVDAVFFQMYATGIARVWMSLFLEWSASEFRHQLLILDRAKTAPRIPGLEYLDVTAFDYQSIDLDRVMLQQICESVGANVFCSTYYTIPQKTRSVFMLYDMIPEILAESGQWDLHQPMWQAKTAALAHATSFISISANSASDLTRYVPRAKDCPMTIAHCGCDFARPAAEDIAAFRERFAIERPYFMMAGARSNYKNGVLFLAAFARLAEKRADFSLVFCGGLLALEAEFSALTGSAAIHMLRLDDADLQCAYAGAEALVFPSRYEGFGMPVIEAMACGCPVITCPTGSIPEVAGNAALFVDPDDVDGMLSALLQVQVPTVRQGLIDAGYVRARQFSWQRMALEVQGALLGTAQ